MGNLFCIYKDKYNIKFNIFGIKISHKCKKDNFIYVVEPSGEKKKVDKIEGLDIKFNSINSSVTVFKPFINFKNSKIILNENCHAVIKEKTEETLNGLYSVSIEMHDNAVISIGKNFYNTGSYYLIVNNSLEIGDDCMFSTCLKILCGDSHKIINMENNGIISNVRHDTIIGDHVWIGLDSKILKGAQIPSGSIVGASSVVKRKFNEQNIVIAGNPAEIVKHNIKWEK